MPPENGAWDGGEIVGPPQLAVPWVVLKRKRVGQPPPGRVLDVVVRLVLVDDVVVRLVLVDDEEVLVRVVERLVLVLDVASGPVLVVRDVLVVDAMIEVLVRD